MAMAMDESLFRGRQIKVSNFFFRSLSFHFSEIHISFVQVNPKRTNRPGLSTTNRGGPVYRARGMRSRGYRGASNYMYGYRPMRRGR